MRPQHFDEERITKAKMEMEKVRETYNRQKEEESKTLILEKIKTKHALAAAQKEALVRSKHPVICG